MKIVNGPIWIIDPAVAATLKSRFSHVIIARSLRVDRRVRLRYDKPVQDIRFFLAIPYEEIWNRCRRVNHEFDEGNHALCVLNFRMFSDLFDERSNVERIHRAFFRYDVDTRKGHSKDDVVTGSTTNKSHSVTDARSQHATVAIS